MSFPAKHTAYMVSIGTLCPSAIPYPDLAKLAVKIRDDRVHKVVPACCEHKLGLEL